MYFVNIDVKNMVIWEQQLLITWLVELYSSIEYPPSPRECLDPFEKLECEAFDIFVNKVLCVGKGCPYSCVKRAPHAFSFASIGNAWVSSQGYFRRHAHVTQSLASMANINSILLHPPTPPPNTSSFG
uniref:Uncharacterized protein n=1 Tax=Quercus lobata TaxID=97700 RepID=A0A7N2L4R1_QUELO